MNKGILKKWWFWVLSGSVILCLFFCAIFTFFAGIAGLSETSETPKTEIVEETAMPEKEEESTVEPTEKATEKPKTAKNPKKTKKPKETKKPNKKQTKEDKVTDLVQSYIDDGYTLTDIDYISVNDDLGTKKKGDYIVLVYLIWNQKNSGKTSKEMLTMYSNDLAARLCEDLKKAQEITVFWEVPFLDADAKMAFIRRKNKMYLDDEYWDLAFDE